MHARHREPFATRDLHRFVPDRPRNAAAQRTARLVRFAFVGATGLVVNTLLLAGLTEVIGVYYLLAAVLATQAQPRGIST